ncbi:MAG: hypothetical protein NC409_12455 [Clostridium sp.]|nr:hypothetical protein [Clostridium sp.]
MNNVRMMYLRPANLFKYFIIEHNEQIITDTGRVANKYTGDGTQTLRGCLAEASADDRENHSRNDHIITHTIVQDGSPKAKESDKLILGERVFYIVDIDDAGGLGISTIYYAEERRDAK